VIKRYERVESSMRGERKEFAAMLAFAQAQNETVAIVADAVDHFQRSFKESVLGDGRKVPCAEPLRKRAQKPRVQTPQRRVGREGTARLPEPAGRE
jgi:hypothetical protein